ncbi:WD40-repeat-containing domain protein [Catenaria anguillulae PL171]|uniref:WD40-repeat-containing domain protein n=1 Tax=Catenaria anguillulae PL171 TaxID=765915 RepID=A0A1Y2HWR7_9FUNG|nr:WD40-repeat-containing domain protein [Catenaria anguillulae PL171]
MEIVYVYQKKRRDFGRQPLLADRPPDLSVHLPPDPQYADNYRERNPISVEMQAAPDMSEHEVNTDSVVMANVGIQHTEGGWPKDVDSSDVEHTLRYRRKVEKDEEYMRVVKSLSDTMEHCIKQNNAIDIYGEYFAGVKEELATDPPMAKTLNVYRDPNPVKRAASHVSWYPEDGNKIAVAYSVLDFQRTPMGMTYESYIWDIENPNQPDLAILPASPLVCLKYNPKDPHVLVGGSYNGLVAYWDTRKGSYPVDSSAIDKAHREPVSSVAWVQSKTGSEFFSASTDGQVMWWDIRKLSEPTETMFLDAEKNGRIVGGTILDFEPTMPTKFMVGTEAGLITMCNKKAKSPSDRISHSYAGHFGPVRALQRNPFFTKNFLTVGDWSAKLWSEDVRSSIMQTRFHTSYLTDGCWSPVRPSVFFTGKSDGSVDVWDCLFKQHTPTLSVPVGNSPVTSLKVQEHGRMMAVTSRDGSTTLLELSESLSRMQPGEKATFSQMLEREAKREKALEAAAREKRLKAQQAKRPTSGAKAPGGGGMAMSHVEDMVSADVVSATEAEFFKILEEEKNKGLKKDKAAHHHAEQGHAP